MDKNVEQKNSPALSAAEEKKMAAFKKLVELQMNSKIKCLQADLGTEFKPLIPFLTQHGILFITSYQQRVLLKLKPSQKHFKTLVVNLMFHPHWPAKICGLTLRLPKLASKEIKECCN